MLICLVYISFGVVSVQICPLVEEGLFLLNSESYFYNLDTSALSLTIYDCGQESLRRNGVAIMVNKRFQNAVLGCNLKNDIMISVCFQGKPFNITVIQVYAPASNAEEAESEQFYEDLQDLLELTPKKDVLFIWTGMQK